jgi:hypothetical protein
MLEAATQCITLQRMARSGQLNARVGEQLLARLERRSRELGESKSRPAERLIDEGLRMEEFPGIVFRAGPTGRRAGLARGPDVWEVIADLQRAKRQGGADAVETVVRGTGLSEEQVRLAAAYYDRYPDEVDARIARNDELHRTAEQALAKLTE